MRWRLGVVVPIVVCAALMPALSALAHNGIGAAFKGQAGRYIVYDVRSGFTATGPDGVDVKAKVTFAIGCTVRKRPTSMLRQS